jgi:hypothetical protein
MGVQQNQLGMQATRQNMAFDAEKMQMTRDQAKAEAARLAATASAAEVEAEMAQTSQIMMGAAPLYSAWKSGDQQAGARLAQYLSGMGIQVTPETMEQTMFAIQGGLDGLKAGLDTLKMVTPQQADPMKGVPSGYLPVEPGNLAAGVKPLPGYAPQPMVSVNTNDNSGAFVKKADELAATRLSDVVATGQSAQQMMGDLAALAEIAKGLDTGLAAQVTAQLGPFADAFGIDIQGLGPAQAYDAIVARMAPQMRPPGSGASSDFDAKQFLKSLPGLGKTPEGNAIISATLQAIQQQKIASADIASRALVGEITWQEADKQIMALGNPFDAFNKFKGMGEAAAQGQLTEDELQYLGAP